MADNYQSHASEDDNKIPPWVSVLYESRLHGPCSLHPHEGRKNEADKFCTKCVKMICTDCQPEHINHNFIKIRRDGYGNLINREDIRKLFDCKGIQTYSRHGKKAIYIEQGPSRSNKVDPSKKHSCTFCKKSLHGISQYCSMKCKVLHIQIEQDAENTGTEKNGNGDTENAERDGLAEDSANRNREVEEGGNSEAMAPRNPKRARKGVPIKAPKGGIHDLD